MSFVSNVDAIVKHLGAQYPGIVMNLASVRWESDEERDSFLQMMSGRLAR
jgi:hypothetical protein